jgi:hypothetical protein
MSSVSMTSADTLKINDRIINDLADGDAVSATFPTEIATVKTGKNGNTLYAQNFAGENAELVIRVVRGSADDKFLNNLLANQKADFAAVTLINSEFIKRVGDGAGKINQDIYILAGGVFSKNVEGKTNAEGDTEQSICIYTLKFSKGQRALV